MSYDLEAERAAFELLMKDRTMTNTPKTDKRIRCRFCGIATWMTDYAAFMRDHDRADGRVCRQAKREHEKGWPRKRPPNPKAIKAKNVKGQG